MPKNFSRRIRSQTSGGRSRSRQFSVQSSTSAQSLRTGPSMKACSSGLSVAGGIARSSFQSGLPLKIAPSHQTVPASIASRSVSEIGGIRRDAQRKMGRDKRSRRKLRKSMQSASLAIYDDYSSKVGGMVAGSEIRTV